MFQQIKSVFMTGILGGLLLASHNTIASPGCAQVNNGAWNQSLQSFAIGATLGNFDNGDKIHFSVAGNGQLAFLGSSGGSFIDLLVTNSPGSSTYTVASPYTTFRTLNDAVSGPLNITATCTPAPIPPSPLTPASIQAHTPEGFQKQIAMFLFNRINGILLNDSDNASLLNRRDKTSKPETRLTAAELANVNNHFSPLNFWIDGQYSAFKDNPVNFGQEGYVSALYIGGDYLLGPNMMLGSLLQFDWTKNSSFMLGAKLNGNGWLAGPYFSARIDGHLVFDLRAAWGQSSNNLALDSSTGNFDTSRWLIKSRLGGNWSYEHWQFTPSTELAYMSENHPDFTTTTRILVPEQHAALGRLQFGPELSYNFFHQTNILLQPFTAIRGLWDFKRPQLMTIDGTLAGPGEFWGRLEGGLTARLSDITLRTLASWDGLGASGYHGYTIQCTLILPFG